MITQKPRSQLVEPYKNEPVCVLGTRLKCAACVLVIGVLALVGTTRESTDVPIAHAQPPAKYSTTRVTPAYRQPANVWVSQSGSATRMPPDSVELSRHSTDRSR